MVFMAEITFGGNFFIGEKSAELNPFSTVSQVTRDQLGGHQKGRAIADPALICR
jgi:hypothetical protein